jgi:hypothetical protein
VVRRRRLHLPLLLARHPHSQTITRRVRLDFLRPALRAKQRIVALDYADQDDLESGDARLVRLAKCSVIGEVVGPE